jgi:hypothetical protein
MPAKARPPSSTLRPDQASATELIAGGSQIAIPAKQPLSELTQAPVAEYVLPASHSSIDQEEADLFVWAERNHRIFSSEDIQQFEIRAGCKGGGSEHDAWVVTGKDGKVVIRCTIQDSYGFRFSSPFSYLRRMAEFSSQVPSASVSFLGVSRNVRGNGVIWTVQPYIEGTHPTQAELVAELKLQQWKPAVTQHNHLVFEHIPSGIRMHDVHAGNFIRQKNGTLIPIDVFFEGLSSEQEEEK